MSNTVYPLCAQCCLKFRLLRPHNAQRWGMALSSTSSVLITRPLSSDIHTEHAYIHTWVDMLFCMLTRTFTQWNTHNSWCTCTSGHAHAQSHAHPQKHTKQNKSRDSFLSTEKSLVPQKSPTNSYSSALLTLSGSEASLGIDCQAYCVYYLSTISQRENTSMLGERHLH